MHIIFDMDGTLIDSAKITIPAFHIVCPKHNLAVPSDNQIISAIGYANPMFYYKIFPDEDKSVIDAFGKDVEKTEQKIIHQLDSDLLFDNIRNLLAVLKDKNIKMFVASTGSIEHVTTCLNHAYITSHFTDIKCNQPDKEYMVASIIENNPTESWIMIGDKIKDSNAAKHNGILAVGAGYGYCSQSDYKQFDEIIHEPMELLKLINT